MIRSWAILIRALCLIASISALPIEKRTIPQKCYIQVSRLDGRLLGYIQAKVTGEFTLEPLNRATSFEFSPGDRGGYLKFRSDDVRLQGLDPSGTPYLGIVTTSQLNFGRLSAIPATPEYSPPLLLSQSSQPIYGQSAIWTVNDRGLLLPTWTRLDQQAIAPLLITVAGQLGVIFDTKHQIVENALAVNFHYIPESFVKASASPPPLLASTQVLQPLQKKTSAPLLATPVNMFANSTAIHQATTATPAQSPPQSYSPYRTYIESVFPHLQAAQASQQQVVAYTPQQQPAAQQDSNFHQAATQQNSIHLRPISPIREQVQQVAATQQQHRPLTQAQQAGLIAQYFQNHPPATDEDQSAGLRCPIGGYCQPQKYQNLDQLEAHVDWHMDMEVLRVRVQAMADKIEERKGLRPM